MQDLLLWARKDSAIHAAALRHFKHFAAAMLDPWSSVSAVCGMEVVDGPGSARAEWLALLQNPRPEIARHAAMAIVDPSYAPILLKLLETSQDQQFKNITLRTLGRLKDPEAFPALLAALDDPATRPVAAEALGDLKAPRAIPHLEALLQDHTMTGYVDNHGPPLLVSDIAGAAISRIKHVSATAPPPLKVIAPAIRSRASILPFLPLICLGGVVVAFVIIVFVVIVQSQGQGNANTRGRDLIVLIPAITGVICGIVALVKRKLTTPLTWIAFAIGTIGCGLATFSFGYELLH